MDKKSIAALYQDLPELIEKNILSPEAAENLRRHYGPAGQETGSRTLLLVFGVFGSLLVGLGIILLIAHNWEQFTRPQRLGLSVLLLAAAQLLAGLSLYKRQNSRIWTEGAALLHTLALGAALALIGQTYHLTEAMDSFILSWLLLALPLVYLMRSGSVALLCLAAIAYWSASLPLPSERYWSWLLLTLLLPYYFQRLRQDRESNQTAILSWGLNLCLYALFAATFGHWLNRYGLLIYNALFALNYLVGTKWFAARPDRWRMPFRAIGLAGMLITCFWATFHYAWRYQKLSSYTPSSTELFLSIVLILLLSLGNLHLFRQKQYKSLAFSFAPLVIGAAYLAQYFDAGGTVATIIVNAYFFILGVWLIAAGARRQSTARINAGMLLLAVLIGARFLDAEFSFIVRGLVFVAIGTAFLITNWLLVRRKGGDGHE